MEEYTKIEWLSSFFPSEKYKSIEKEFGEELERVKRIKYWNEHGEKEADYINKAKVRLVKDVCKKLGAEGQEKRFCRTFEDKQVVVSEFGCYPSFMGYDSLVRAIYFWRE